MSKEEKINKIKRLLLSIPNVDKELIKFCDEEIYKINNGTVVDFEDDLVCEEPLPEINGLDDALDDSYNMN